MARAILRMIMIMWRRSELALSFFLSISRDGTVVMPTAPGGRSTALSPAALILHGKLGRFDRGVAGSPARAVQAGVTGSLDLAVFCYAAFVRHIIEPSRHAGLDVQVFGHSWSPDIGEALDALFRPRASSHEPEATERNHRLCRSIADRLRQSPSANGFNGFYFGGDWAQDSCERTASHLLGIARAVALQRRAERRDGIVHQRVLISRWDTLWQRPLPLTSLPIARGVFVLPHMCVSSPALDARAGAAANAQLGAHRTRVCNGEGYHPSPFSTSAAATPPLVTTAAVECHPGSRGCSHDLTAAARGVFLLDWWIATTSADASAFAALGEAAHFSNLTSYAAAALHVHRVEKQVMAQRRPLDGPLTSPARACALAGVAGRHLRLIPPDSPRLLLIPTDSPRLLLIPTDSPRLLLTRFDSLTPSDSLRLPPTPSCSFWSRLIPSGIDGPPLLGHTPRAPPARHTSLLTASRRRLRARPHLAHAPLPRLALRMRRPTELRPRRRPRQAVARGAAAAAALPRADGARRRDGAARRVRRRLLLLRRRLAHVRGGAAGERADGPPPGVRALDGRARWPRPTAPCDTPCACDGR